MSKYVGLRHFNHDELIFDTQETVVILRFIFKHKQPLIDRMEIDDKVRGFTQGLLVEAVDASCSMSYVEALFKASISPGVEMKSIIKKFAKKAAKSWFKYATATDLLHVKIYESVRRQLEMNFGRVLVMYADGIAQTTATKSALITYDAVLIRDFVWG